MPYDSSFLDAYASYEHIIRSANSTGSNPVRVEVYLPDPFIELLRENIQLKEKLSALRRVEFRLTNEVQMNLNLLDKLRYLAEVADGLGVKIPFRIDGTPR